MLVNKALLYVGGAAGAALLIALVIVSLLYRSALGTIETQRNALADCNTARRVQNAAIERAGQESQRQQQAFSEAVQSGQAEIAAAASRVTVVRQTARNNCDTPPQVMGAGL